MPHAGTLETKRDEGVPRHRRRRHTGSLLGLAAAPFTPLERPCRCTSNESARTLQQLLSTGRKDRGPESPKNRILPSSRRRTKTMWNAGQSDGVKKKKEGEAHRTDEGGTTRPSARPKIGALTQRSGSGPCAPAAPPAAAVTCFPVSALPRKTADCRRRTFWIAALAFVAGHEETRTVFCLAAVVGCWALLTIFHQRCFEGQCCKRVAQLAAPFLTLATVDEMATTSTQLR